MSSSGNTTGAVTGGDTSALDTHGVANSSAEAVAQTGTCFRAGPIAFTDTGQALVEVIEVPHLSPVGGTQAWFLGQAVYRSELLPVTDFALWAGLSERPFKAKAAGLAATGSSSDTVRSPHRILVLQREHDTSDASVTNRSEKIGLLVSEVSGHVVIEPGATAQSGQPGGEAPMAILNQRLAKAGLLQSDPGGVQTGQPGSVLQALIKSTWHSTEPVFVIDLQRLFELDVFINIGARDFAVPDSTHKLTSEHQVGRHVEALS